MQFVFEIPFFCFVEEQFHECLDVWRRSYELWILVINAVADMEKQLLFNKEFAAESVVIYFIDLMKLCIIKPCNCGIGSFFTVLLDWWTSVQRTRLQADIPPVSRPFMFLKADTQCLRPPDGHAFRQGCIYSSQNLISL